MQEFEEGVSAVGHYPTALGKSGWPRWKRSGAPMISEGSHVRIRDPKPGFRQVPSQLSVVWMSDRKGVGRNQMLPFLLTPD